MAVKVLDNMDARAMRDFKHEVAFLMNLHHSYVVQFLGACITVRCTRHAEPVLLLSHVVLCGALTTCRVVCPHSDPCRVHRLSRSVPVWHCC